jgi:hypothetical protein
MKYIFTVDAVAHEEQLVLDKHREFVEALGDLPDPWAMNKDFEIRDEGFPATMLKLYKVLGAGVRGDLLYTYRQPFEDKGSNDDWVRATYNPAKLNHRELIYDVLPQYVKAFRAYRANITDDKFMDIDGSKALVNTRYAIYRLDPVTFMSNWLCERALKMDAATVAKKLEGHVEDVRVADDGVYIVITSEVMPTEKLDGLCWETKARLLGE